MKAVNYLAKPTKAVAVVIHLTDGVVLSGNVFIPTQWRITDLLNDERGFLPMQTADGAMIAIAKSSIKQVTLPQAETKVYSGRDPYRILGVPQGTSAEDIKAAYHNLCKINHPDLIRSMGLGPDFQELASRNMARINAAYAEIMSALTTLAAVRRDRPKKQALAEESLKEREERFRSLVEQEPAAIFVVDEQLNLTYVNGDFLQAQGFERQEVEGRLLTDFVRHGDQPEIIRTFAALRSGEISSAHVRAGVLRKDGSYIEMLGHGRMANLDGKPVIVAVTIDITEHLQAEEHLREEENRFLYIVEENAVIAYVADADGKLAYINRGFEAVSGYTREEVIGSPTPDFVLDEPPAVAAIPPENEQSPPVEIRLKRKHGDPAVVLMQRSLAGSDDRPPGIGVGVDITERKKTEDNLREENGKFRGLIEEAVAGIYVVGEDGNIIYSNPQFEEMLGVPQEEVVGRPLLDFIADEDQKRIAPALAAWLTESSGSILTQLKRKDGGVLDVLLQGKPASQGSMRTVTGIAVEITGLKDADKQLCEEKNRFLSMVEQTPAALLVFDEQMNFACANSDFLHAHGFEPQEVIGHHVTDFLRESDRPETVRAFAALESGEMSSARVTAGIVRKDGGYAEMLLQGRMASFNGKSAIFAVAVDITDRLQAEEKLRADGNRFRAVVDQCLTGIEVIRPDGTLLYQNAFAAGLTGFTPTQILEHSLLEVVEESGKAAIAGQMQSHLSGQSPQIQVTTALQNKPGQQTDVVLIASMGVYEGGPASFIVAAEISELKRAERKLREEESKFRALVEQNLAGTYVVGENGKMVYANPGFEKLCGYPLNEVIGRPLLDFIADADKEVVASALAARQDGQAGSTTVRLKRKNGALVDVLEQGTLVRYDGTGAIIGSAIDVSELKRAEEKEREDKNRFRAAMEAAPDAILLYDCDLDRIIGANKAAERLFACPGDEIVKHHLLHFFSSDQPDARPAVESFAAHVEQLLSGNEIRYEMRIQNNTGQQRLCEVALAQLPNGPQKLLRASFVDVTEQRSAERALRTLTCGTQAVVRATDENELLRSICRVLAEVGEYHVAWYGVPQRDEAKSISLLAWAGNVQDVLETTRFSWSDSSDNPGPWGRAINTGQPQVVQDFASDPTLASLQEMAARYDMRSCAVLPVKVEWESLFGILVVYSRRAHTFDAASLRTLEELANDLAYAISTMRLRGERQKSLAQLLRGVESTVQTLASTVELRNPYAPVSGACGFDDAGADLPGRHESRPLPRSHAA